MSQSNLIQTFNQRQATEIKHVCRDCGEVIAVHFHNSWESIKACLLTMRVQCEQCRLWPGSPVNGGKI